MDWWETGRPPPPWGVSPLPMPIEGVVAGTYQVTPRGSCFVGKKDFPHHYSHGHLPLSSLLEQPGTLASTLGRDPTLREMEFATTAFLDVETTGLAIDSSTLVFLVGVGYFDQQGFHIQQYFLREESEEPAMLYALHELMGGFRWLVTFNGKKFDWPLLETRFFCAGLEPGLPELPHLDLLYPARRLWRNRLDSCALSSLEQHVLGVGRGQDVPSWQVPHLYLAYRRTGDAHPLQPVFEHNAQDILSLVTLASLMLQMFEYRGIEDQDGVDLYNSGRLLEERADLEGSAHCYERALARRLPASLRQAAMQRLAFVYKRRREGERAAALWQSILQCPSGSQSLTYYEELAKYYEHSARDYRQAEAVVQEALAMLEKHRPLWDQQRYQAEQARLTYRLARLRLKIANATQP